ncbi:hypothetical protein AMTRI_Chr02g254930 [Amborella trichopoda]
MAYPIHERAQEAFSEFVDDPFLQKHGVIRRQSHMRNRRGLDIYTQSWAPAGSSRRPCGLVCMIHGFMVHSGGPWELTAIAMVKQGFAVYALDLQGHGRSEGLRGYIPDIQWLLDDCIEFFNCSRAEAPGLPAFLYGESLGGALALLVSLRQPGVWRGVILSGPMCGIARSFMPPWPLELLLPLASIVVPTWKAVPTQSLVKASYKEPTFRKLIRTDPYLCRGLPRVASARELLKACDEVQRRSYEVCVPLLILHGDTDHVCDVKATEVVYERVQSHDKTLKILPGMWHQLIGEPPENVDCVFKLVFSWLRDRATGACNGNAKG